MFSKFAVGTLIILVTVDVFRRLGLLVDWRVTGQVFQIPYRSWIGEILFTTVVTRKWNLRGRPWGGPRLRASPTRNLLRY
jgi:hypothetical protein